MTRSEHQDWIGGDQSGTGRLVFPPGFRWGAATAAYQIEGGARDGGRTPSIWDTFSHTPGKVHNGDTGDVACDHYHRYRDDVALMAGLGLRTYRFSISWPRLQPHGTGPINPVGLDFYQRLVDELLAHDIEPWITLYHWDLPQELEDAGGWPVRDTAARFADYAALAHGALGDRVKHWLTLNEPWCSASLGYATGEHAPGGANQADAMRAVHHLLLGHGLAIQAMRAQRDDTKLGITLNPHVFAPASDDPADIDAARRIDAFGNRVFYDPLLRGAYPADLLEDLAGLIDFAHVRDGDLATIATPIDHLGLNYYSRSLIAAPEDGGPTGTGDLTNGSSWTGADRIRFVRRGLPETAMGWEIDAEGLTALLVRIHREYPGIDLFITENGAAFDDEPNPDGTVDDPARVSYLDGHLRACHAAIAQGVPLRGYFAWSLLDNFEWGFGYAKRFGLVYVDYPTQRRLPKTSARWYAGVIADNAVPAQSTP